uniref:LSM7 homolog, U6 small nuclear RNA associated n=4 Tax=Nothobranchius TaxID=28779 RepID=A0A1A8L774_9TELE
MADKEKKKKESIFDLSKYIDKTIRVKFQGGREASGVLKGFDPLLNLVLDGTIEYMRGKKTKTQIQPENCSSIRVHVYIDEGLFLNTFQSSPTHMTIK